MTLAAFVDWANVGVALLVGLPGLVSAAFAYNVHRKIKTPSGTPIGHQVENVLHTSLANHYRIRKIGGAVGADESPKAQSEAEQVPNLPEADGEPL